MLVLTTMMLLEGVEPKRLPEFRTTLHYIHHHIDGLTDENILSLGLTARRSLSSVVQPDSTDTVLLLYVYAQRKDERYLFANGIAG